MELYILNDDFYFSIVSLFERVFLKQKYCKNALGYKLITTAPVSLLDWPSCAINSASTIILMCLETWQNLVEMAKMAVLPTFKQKLLPHRQYHFVFTVILASQHIFQLEEITFYRVVQFGLLCT